jgi:phosphate transport system substrate-binding protein
VKGTKWFALAAVVAIVAGAVALAGCGTKAPAANTSTTPASKELSGSLTISGSDTMINLAQAWSEQFMKDNPGVSVSVKGGGSGTGIAALINGTVDFADASRAIEPAEAASIKSKGGEAVTTVVGNDGIAIIVNSANKVEALTKDQLGKIYRGEIKNWKDVGGADVPITLVSRDPSSGTYTFLHDTVLGKTANYAPSAKLLPSTQAIVDEVKSDANAIGYVGLGYENSSIKVVAIDGIKASVASVTDNSYLLSRPLNMISNGAPKDLAKAYVDWILSPAGQKIVADQGFVPVTK